MVESRPAELEWLYNEVFGAEQSPPAPSLPARTTQASPQKESAASNGHLSDERILELAQRSRKGGSKFSALWSGQWNSYFSSQSEADSSVAFTLAFYTKDACQIDRMFRTSGLMR
jgi:putative DNA primase/helicase